jgi:hypothetical protein
VIVRIATEGQYELPDSKRDELSKLDDEAVAACTTDDEERFRAVFTRLLEFVRSNGSPVGDDDLRGSDVILPPPDVSLEEAKEGFTGEGLIPS